MSAGISPTGIPSARPLHGLIGTTRRLLRSTWVLTGLGLTLGLLLGTLVATTAADMVLPIDPAASLFGVQVDGWVRLLALMVILVPAVWALVVGVLAPLLRRLAAVNVARRIERKLPGIHNRLVSVLDYDTPEARATVSPTFYRRLVNEALERIRGFRPSLVLDLRSLRKAGVFAFSTAAAFALAWVLFSHRLPTALARILNPFADIPPVGSVVYQTRIFSEGDDDETAEFFDVKTNRVDVLREEEVVFEAKVKDGAPKDLRVELYASQGGAVIKEKLMADSTQPGTWTCKIDGARIAKGFEKGFGCRFYGGGTWSKLYTVNLVERPVILGDHTQVKMHYPKYMARPEPHVNPPQTADVTGPEGGAVELVVQAEGEVARGELQLLERSRRLIPARKRADRLWFEDQVPTNAVSAGSWDWDMRDDKAVHTETASPGEVQHSFSEDPVGFPVKTGDNLFVHVFLPMDATPRALMLQWSDGTNWEHGAYWGADSFRLKGKAGSPARRRMADLPEAGKWVRLEVPASEVHLEGRIVKGMAFMVDGGQALWHKAGAVATQESSFKVLQRYEMKALADGRWSGRLPLEGAGLYRAELRNSAGHPNKRMNEAKFTSLVDQPPTVFIERPGKETVIGQAFAIPLTVRAQDDYGLAEINLLTRGGDGGDYQLRNLVQLKTPDKDRTVGAALTEAASLSMGGKLRYKVQARDRKGQIATSEEYSVLISSEGNTDDKKLEAFDKAQDPFQSKLVQLLAQQKDVKDKMDKLAKENAETILKAKKAEEKAKLDEPAPIKIDPKTGKPIEPEPALKLDAETAKKLAEIQKQLNDLAKQEEQVAAAAQQVGAEMQKQVEAASDPNLLLPKFIPEDMAQAQQNFQQQVANAMRDLAQRMARNADPKQNAAPDMKALNAQADRLLKELESAKNRQQALADARQALKRDKLDEIMKRLERNKLNEEGGLNAREAEELRQQIARMIEEMQRLKGKQEEIARDMANADSADAKARAEARQAALDRELDRVLDDAKQMLEGPRMKGDQRADRRGNKRKPDFPDAPFQAEGDENKVPPREKDSDEPLPGAKDKKKGGPNTPRGNRADKKGMRDDDEEEEKNMPALGGRREKADERFAKKDRPLPKKGEKPDNAPDGPREGNDGDNAEKALGNEKEGLDKLLDDLKEALANAKEGQGKEGQGKEGQGKEGQGKEGQGKEGQGKEGQGKEGQGKEGQGEGKEGQGEGQGQSPLADLLNSPQMRAMRAMANRMRQSNAYQGRPNASTAQRQPGQSSQGNMNGGFARAETVGDLADLDPATQRLILRMPPRLREELVQGMKEQGPEGYRQFIENYFKRLAPAEKTAPKR